MIFFSNNTKSIMLKTKHAKTFKQSFNIKQNRISLNHTKTLRNSLKI